MFSCICCFLAVTQGLPGAQAKVLFQDPTSLSGYLVHHGGVESLAR